MGDKLTGRGKFEQQRTAPDAWHIVVWSDPRITGGAKLCKTFHQFEKETARKFATDLDEQGCEVQYFEGRMVANYVITKPVF